MGNNVGTGTSWWRVVLSLVLAATVIVVGCTGPTPVEQAAAKQDVSDPFSGRSGRQYDSISELELSHLINKTDRPVLVEFGVDFNCPRCEQMTPVMNDLATQFSDQTQIVRAAFNPSSNIQSELGLRYCPSYFFFDNGQLVGRCDGPTMYPVLKSKLSQLVTRSREPDVDRRRTTTQSIEVSE